MTSGKVVALPVRARRFDHILVPTDGSPLSMASALKALEFARRIAGRVVALHVVPTYQYPVYLGGIPFEYPSESDYEKQCRAVAEGYVGLIAHAGTAMGVLVDTRVEFSREPAQAIVDAAKREKCGLIYMGSHGRTGLSKLFLGSVTLKTLTLSPLPVLVDRPSSEEVAHAQALMDQSAIEP